MTTSLLPRDVLNIGTEDGENHFNEGIGRNTGHTDYSPSQIENGYSSDPEFKVVIYNGVPYVQLRVNADAQTTSSGTKWPRSELREMEENATDNSLKMAFNAASGNHWAKGKSRLMKAMTNKPWICFAQTHNGGSDLMRAQAEGNKLVCRNTPPGSSTETVKTIQATYNWTDEIDWEINITAGSGVFKLGGTTVQTFPASISGCYFKAGCYSQSGSINGTESASDYAVVYLRDLQHWHTGWPTPDPVGSGTGGGTGGGTTGTGQTLGVGGIAAPAPASNVELNTADRGDMNITASGTAAVPRIYDGGGKTSGRITISADYIVVQNYYIKPNSQYALYITGSHVTVQNCDIKNVSVSGDGDLNAITLLEGSDIDLLFLTANNYISGDPGDSHTDFVQTWVSSSHDTPVNDVRIIGCQVTGPANPSRSNSIASIHQIIMVESAGHGGNSGGSGTPSNWLIADNELGASWGQDVKLDGGNNFVFTRNRWVGSSDRIFAFDAGTGNVVWSDNIFGSGYGQVGATITQGNGPPSGIGGATTPVVNAGTDATIQVNTTFSRTATETNSPSARTWKIQSGPAGVGNTISTSTLLNWIPTQTGTYVLRFSATNAGGTTSDDVTVTVTTTGQTGGGTGTTSTLPTIRSSSVGKAASTGATSFTIPKPAGLVVGDYLITAVTADADGTLASLTMAAGHPLIGSSDPDKDNNAPAFKLWAKVATATETGATNFTINGNGQSDMSGVMIAITKDTFNPDTPITLGTIMKQVRTATTTQTAPAITGVVDGRLLAFFGSDINNVTQAYPTSGPSGMTLVQSIKGDGNYVLTGVYSQALTAAGSTSSKAVSPTPSSSTNGWVAVLAQINPATTATGGGGPGGGATSTFGKTDVGGATTTSSGDKLIASSATPTVSGKLIKGTFRAWMDAGASTVAKMAVYSNSGTAPNIPLATSDELTITNTAAQWLDFTFSGTQQIDVVSSTVYWISVTWDDPGTLNLNYTRGATASARQEASGYTYPNLPNPFGTPTAQTGPIDAYLTTQAAGAPSVSAGPDTSIVQNVQFTRSASENPNGVTITGRAWTIVSGPTGAGTTIGTAVTLNWTPTVVGNYVLRYTITYSGGSTSDDVTVQVSTTTSGGGTGVPPSFVAVGVAASGLSATINPAAPAGVVVGQFQVCGIICAATETITNVPTDWFLLDTVEISSPAGDPGGPASTWLYYNTTGADIATWTKSGSRYFHAVRAVWKDQTALGTHIGRTEGAGTGSRNHSTSTVIPSNSDSRVVSFIMSDMVNGTASPFTPPPGWVERYDANKINTVDAENESIAIADTVSSTTITGVWVSTNPDECAIYTFVLEGPIVGGGGEDPIDRPILDAGPDVTVQVGASPFTRSVAEDDTGSTITVRSWRILTGPAEVDVVLSTGVSVTWSPTAVGTYVLQYSATNGVGTSTDNVTVTVQTGPVIGPTQKPAARVNGFFALARLS